MRFFSNTRISSTDDPSSLLWQFALALDHELTAKGLRVINGPGLNLIEFKLEMQAHCEQVGPGINQIQTPRGVFLTKSPLYEHDYPIIVTMATAEEIHAHYKKIAEVTLQRGTTNCEGLAAVTLLLSEALSKREPYNKIQVQICQLLNWRHVFVRFKHMDESQGLFYDPWFQRCQTKTPHVPVLIKEDAFHEKMREMVSYVYSQPEQAIAHIDYFHVFDPTTRQLLNAEKINYNHDYRYSIIYSSMIFPPRAEQRSAPCVIS